MEYVTRGVCGQEGCRETRYYLDNGLWFCLRGHQQEVRAPCIAVAHGWKRSTTLTGGLIRLVFIGTTSRGGS